MKNIFGVDCMEWKSGNFELLLATSIGPRILAMEFKGSGNLFAELPDDYLVYQANEKKFNFYGGHRLWIAPEEPETTYLPDDHPVQVSTTPDGIELAQDSQTFAGLKKTIRIQSVDYPDMLIVDHLVRNESDSPRRIAPWAITQLKLGGTAILPLVSAQTENPLLPNRSLVLWPYTNMQDERIWVGSKYVVIESLPKIERPLKVGVNNWREWVAYFINGNLFIKYSRKDNADCALDLGAEAQCYCNHKFLELETLGIYKAIEPGEELRHREIWRMVERPFKTLNEDALDLFIENDIKAEICRGLL